MELTRESIMSMSAGRELDEMIAVKVMGYTLRGDHCYVKNEHGGESIFTFEPTSFGSFMPSTDIGAAWEVFEKVDYNCEHSNLRHGKMGAWSCTFDNVWADQQHTAPVAICRAALLTTLEG